jgi:multidrug efflux pump subunit AcrA (membrane-fusion protein)
VNLGDKIKAGQRLAQLDNEQYELQLQARKAELEATRSQYEDAKLEFQRLDNLSSTGAVSKSSLDRAKHKWIQALRN